MKKDSLFELFKSHKIEKVDIKRVYGGTVTHMETDTTTGRSTGGNHDNIVTVHHSNDFTNTIGGHH